MWIPRTSLGLIPGYGGTQRLPQLIGKGRALEMIFSAKMIDAETALSYGLVNQVVLQEELLEAAKKMAHSFMKNSIVAMGLGAGWAEAGRRLGGGWAMAGRRLGGLWAEGGWRLGGTLPAESLV